MLPGSRGGPTTREAPRRVGSHAVSQCRVRGLRAHAHVRTAANPAPRTGPLLHRVPTMNEDSHTRGGACAIHAGRIMIRLAAIPFFLARIFRRPARLFKRRKFFREIFYIARAGLAELPAAAALLLAGEHRGRVVVEHGKGNGYKR